MNAWKDKAWIVPEASECDDVEKCEIIYDHSSCSYGQPAVLLERATCDLPAGTPIGPDDARGALIQHIGPHKAALESAGWQTTEGLEEAMASRGLLLNVQPAYLDDLPSDAD